MGPSRYQPRDCTQDAPVCLASNSRNADEIPMKADTKGVHSLELEEQDDEIDQYLENEDELNQLLIKAMRTMSDEIEVWEDTLDITKHPEPGSWITQSERDDTIHELQVSNYCNVVLAINNHDEDIDNNMETEHDIPCVYTSPKELNRYQLDNLYEFNKLSKLKNYFTKKTGIEKSQYTLNEILAILKTIIFKEKLLDPNNKSIVLCSKDLEEALDMKALHITEIQHQVLAQITKV